MMLLNEGERLDYVNDKLELIQNGEGLTFGTDALLLAGYIDGRYKCGIELGAGSGIISMLLLTRSKLSSCICLEVQEDYARLSERNAEHNRLSERMSCVCTDIRLYRPDTEADIVYTNPPYMKSDSGKRNISDKKNIARHEVFGTVEDFCKSGAAMLKYGGAFAVVYRPDRMSELLSAMVNAGIEPKRLTLVHADASSMPSMLLCEGKKGARPGMKVTRPLIIYTDSSHDLYTEELNYIMNNGVFPKGFCK